MAAITAAPKPTARRTRPVIWRYVVLGLAAVYFLLPLYSAFRFALRGGVKVFSSIPSQQGFSPAFTLSLRLAAITTVLTLVLVVPTAIHVHLRVPQLRRLFEAITILPIVIPPVVLIVGVLQVAPKTLKGTPYLLALEYTVLAMPFAYRSIDSALRAIDLKTLVEASSSLGGRWPTTFWRVLLPNLRSGLLSATVLTVALVLGEYTMASLDQYQTFSVWVVNFDQDNSYVSVAVSLLALVGTWVLLMLISLLDRRARVRRSPTVGADA